MDKNIRSFICFSQILIIVLACVSAVLGCVYRFFTINLYSSILLIIALVTIIMTIFFILSVIIVVHTYKRKHVGVVFLKPVKLALKVLFPLVVFLTGMFKGDKDKIRKTYIDVNNTLVESQQKRFKPEEILIMLPHCLQNSECVYKITGSIFNCRECGRCIIGEIVKVARSTGVKTIVVTGGTAARNIVKTEKPKIILSVACERDLTAGMADVGSIPVMGIYNKRPNGPCFNTTVDIELFEQKLNDILYKRD